MKKIGTLPIKEYRGFGYIQIKAHFGFVYRLF